MKKLIVLLMFLLFSSICFAREAIDCNRMGAFAAMFTMQKNNGESLTDVKSFINSGSSDGTSALKLSTEEKEVLLILAKQIYDSPTMNKDYASDYYRQQCKQGLSIAKNDS